MGFHEDSDRFPVLSIVIVNSDGLDDTINCIDSIYRYPPQDEFEIVLIDNCSEVPVIDMIRDKYSQVRIFSAAQKQGFSKNYNLGIRHARGEFVMILNNDTIVHDNAIKLLVGALRQNPTYGMIGPKLRSQNGQIQPVCARPLPTPASFNRKQLFLDAGTPTGKFWLSIQQQKLSSRSSGPVPCINGACMLTSKTILDQVGLLDESYDFYFEDVEWCHRVQKHGFKVAYIAEAEITHLGDQSLSKVREWAKKSEYLSALRYFKQYYPMNKASIWILWLSANLSYLLRAVYFSVEKLLTKKENHAETYWRLSGWICHQTPKMHSN